jgi:hypothetical protein
MLDADAEYALLMVLNEGDKVDIDELGIIDVELI